MFESINVGIRPYCVGGGSLAGKLGTLVKFLVPLINPGFSWT